MSEHDAGAERPGGQEERSPMIGEFPVTAKERSRLSAAVLRWEETAFERETARLEAELAALRGELERLTAENGALREVLEAIRKEAEQSTGRGFVIYVMAGNALDAVRR